MADRPKVEFPPNVTVQVTIKFDSAQKSDTNQYGVWYLHTVTWNDEDASLFTDQDLQDLLEARVEEVHLEGLAIQQQRVDCHRPPRCPQSQG